MQADNSLEKYTDLLGEMLLYKVIQNFEDS
jgi:hypothetical protein